MSNFDGGAAFPLNDGDFGSSTGMSMLDYYAGQAMLYVMANNDTTDNPDAYAEICFTLAEAMVRARQRRA